MPSPAALRRVREGRGPILREVAERWAAEHRRPLLAAIPAPRQEYLTPSQARALTHPLYVNSMDPDTDDLFYGLIPNLN